MLVYITNSLCSANFCVGKFAIKILTVNKISNLKSVCYLYTKTYSIIVTITSLYTKETLF